MIPADPAAPPPRVTLRELLRGPHHVRSRALDVLLVFAVFYTMYFTRAVLLPLVLAILLSYLLAPLVRNLERFKIPPFFGAGLVLLVVVAIVGFGVTRLVVPAAAWMQNAPYSLERMQEKLLPLKGQMQKVSEASAQIEKMTTPDGGGPRKTVVEVKSSRFSDLLVAQTPEFLGEVVMFTILLYFLLAYDQIFLTKLVKILPTLQDKKRALCIAREIETSISTYLLTVTCINAGLGLAVGAAVGLLGMPNPVLWGTLVAVFNFIPYLGATCGIVAMTLGAVLSFDSLGWALVFPAVYLAIAILEGNFVTPMILGHSLTLNPIVIVLSLMFWGWLWGIAGAILAVPILATFKILCDHIEPLEPVGEFLST